jgi:LysM repeat protein
MFALFLALILAACNFNTPLPTPTVELLVTPSVTVQPSPSPSLSPSPTLEATLTEVVIATGAPTLPPSVPTLPAVEVTATEGPYVYVIKEQDTLGFILQQQPWGYPPYDPGVIAAVVQLNNLVSENILPPPGSELLIPRRTPTPIPEGSDATATSDASLGTGTRIGNVTLPQGAVAKCYTVVAGDSILGIANKFNTTLEILSQLNQNLNWFGCQFDQYSGGPGCRPEIYVDMCVTVPMPPPTATPSSTPSGNETATPTPTFTAPRGFYPPDGAIAPPRTFTLEWVSVGILGSNDVYLVEVQDTTLGTQWLEVTRNTSILLPDSLIPSDGRSHEFQWRVTVARRNTGGTYDYVGGVGTWRRFTWQNR